MGHSCGLQFLRNCHSVRPFHRVHSPSGTDCSNEGCFGGHRSCQKNCSCTGSSLQPASSFRSHTSLWHGALCSLQDICSTGCKRTSSPAHEGVLPVLLYWPWYLSCFSHTQSSLAAAGQQVLPCCTYITTELLPVLLTGPALASGRTFNLAWYSRILSGERENII